MTQEEKQLLLIDLCARLGDDVKMGDNRGHIGTLKVIDLIHNTIGLKITNIYDEDSILTKGKIDFWKPYLRPMSSMTEKEKKIYHKKNQTPRLNALETPIEHHLFRTQEALDWLNENHFDYRGLIKKDLALKAPVGMYKF